MATSITPTGNQQPRDPQLDALQDSSIQHQDVLARNIDLYEATNEELKRSSQEISNIKSLSTQLNNLLKESITLQSRLGREYIRINEILKDISQMEGHILKVQQQKNITIANFLQKNPKIKKDVEDVLELEKQRLNTIKGINDSIAKGMDPRTKMIIDMNKKAKQLEDDIKKLVQNEGVAQVLLLHKQEYIAKKAVENLRGTIVMQEEYNKLKDEQVEEDKKAIEEMYEKLGSLYKLMTGISKIPLIGDLINAKKITDAMEKSWEANKSKGKAFGAGLKAVGSELDRISADPLLVGGIFIDIFKNLIKGALELDKSMTQFANTLGISRDFAKVIYKDFARIQDNNILINKHLDASLLTITNQGKAMNELNGYFGTAAAFTNEQVQDQIFLTQKMGLTEDVAKGIMQYSVLTNKSATDIVKNINKQNDGLLDYRKIIGQVAKVGGQLFAQYKGNVEAIAKAVVESNKLGISLEQAKKQSDSLLNFQSSIENELEAELITGKQLNLERAKALALMGDSAGAAKEMLAQVGSFSDYSKLNVIAQQSLAKAVGMTSDELTNSLREQQTLTALGATSKDDLVTQLNHLKDINDQRGIAILKQQILAKENGDMLLDNISQMSLQQRFEQSMDKVKEAFADIASGPLISIMNGLAKMVQHTGTLKTLLLASGFAMSFMAARSISMAIASIWTKSFEDYGAIIGLAAAGIGTTLLWNSLNSAELPEIKEAQHVNDGVISPDGRIVISTPKGQIIPDRNDHIVATTTPEKLLNGGGGNNNELIAIMGDIRAMMQKGGNVFLDGRHVGTTVALTYSAYA